MADPSDAPIGRSRGRARGRAAPPPTALEELSMVAMRISPPPGGSERGSTRGSGASGDNDSNGGSNGDDNGGNGGNGNGGAVPAVRGRGGYRGGDMITRPTDVTDKKGSGGTNCTLVSNYFRVRTPTDVVLQKYRLDFEPIIEATRARRRMVYQIRDLFNENYMFDGMNELTSMSRVDDTQRLVSHAVEGGDAMNVTIRVRHTGEVAWGSQEMMRSYNTQMRKNLHHIGYLLMGRNYFDPTSTQNIPDFNINLWSGVVTAIAQHEPDILMVVDLSTKFVRAETVLSVLQSAHRSGGNWKEAAQKEICNMVVMTQYNNRTYKVDDIDFNVNPETCTFERNGRVTNLVDFYREQWNIEIRDRRQPLVKCLPSQRDLRAGRAQVTYLVPELCLMTGLTDHMKSNFNLMKRVGDMSRLAPNQRYQKLKAFIEKMNENPKVKEDMERKRISIDNNLVTLTGRTLQCEKIYMHGDNDNSAQMFDQKTGDFGKVMRSKKLFNPASMNKWAIICGPQQSNLIEEFVQTLNRVCVPMSIGLGRPQQMVLNDDRTGSFVERCKSMPDICEMVVCIVPNNNKERYDAIKKILCCENPRPSQVVVARTLAKKQMLMSVCTKIGIQMACKMGGEAWALKIPPKNIMVVGYDTYHDSLTKGSSVGGFVCSLNAHLTQWYSRVAYHKSQEEMSANFSINLNEGVKRYYEANNGMMPSRIFIYRDGVGEGMIPHVFDFELTQIKKQLSALNQESPPTFAFIIVTKRVNARFFSRNGNAFDNPVPGTIIDNTVTRPTRYDFYLISQSVRQGTVSPTMYNIIYDSSKLPPAHHQQLAYKLTHLYFNWQGTIRVPAPCQYAHKLAYLTGTSLHREPSARLAKQLFYL